MARFVEPDVAHHVTQRGVARQVVFRTRADRVTYLTQLREQAAVGGLAVLAYCLMDNHIHLIVVPRDEASMARVLQRVHGRYAQYFNARLGRCGHLWQNRFSSCALGPGHLYAALRYVERNPVRAGLVERAGEYEWSSAEGHLTGQDRWRIADMGFWRAYGGAECWRRMLAESEDEAWVAAMRRSTYAGQAFGDEEFMDEMRRKRRERKGAGAESEIAVGVGFGCGDMRF